MVSYQATLPLLHTTDCLFLFVIRVSDSTWLVGSEWAAWPPIVAIHMLQWVLPAPMDSGFGDPTAEWRPPAGSVSWGAVQNNLQWTVTYSGEKTVFGQLFMCSYCFKTHCQVFKCSLLKGADQHWPTYCIYIVLCSLEQVYKNLILFWLIKNSFSWCVCTQIVFNDNWK